VSASGRRQRGATLIEVLVTLVVTAFGLLGIAALQMRTYVAEGESLQRAQATVLLDDMVNRLSTNWRDADAYATATAGAGDPEDCSAVAAGAARDLCEWGNLLRGSAELDEATGTRLGAVPAARGCVIRTAPDLYIVAVAWEGTVPTGPAATPCGRGLYSDESVRRAVTAVVRIADLDS